MQEERTIHELSEDRMYGGQQNKHPKVQASSCTCQTPKVKQIHQFNSLGFVLTDDRKFDTEI